jgi:hypothetical protein
MTVLRHLPFVLSLSKHCPLPETQEGQPFDKLRANGMGM